MKSDFIAGIKVKNKTSGEIGVVINDIYRCCDEKEVLVVYDGNSQAIGTDIDILENLGLENAKADPKKCGANQNGKCCLFLVIDPLEPVCTRFTGRRDGVLLNDKGKKRIPTELFPKCQKP